MLFIIIVENFFYVFNYLIIKYLIRLNFVFFIVLLNVNKLMLFCLKKEFKFVKNICYEFKFS